MDAPSYQQLLLENQQLREQVAKLQKTVGDLQKRLEESERAVKRQAAPFSKGKPKKRPKKPGRKSGEQHGDHAHREPPPPTQIDETLEAPLPEQCPECGGAVVADHLDQQFQTEIPRQPIVREFKIHCGHCQKCGKHLRGRHPLQTSDATGAAQSQLGGDAQAAIVYLNKRAGMSHGKIADTFAKVFGISLTRGASAQVVMRAGKILQPVYEQIQERIKDSKHLTPDETGWRIGGHPAWLHGWVGDDGTTCYVIDPQRSADVLEKVIGIDWSGSMTHDGFSSYDRFEDAPHQQCTERPRVNDDNARFAKHLSKHAAGWFLYLVDPIIPATNHRAEQALKTPIVNRKVWGGNRTDAGGKAQADTSSVLQTCQNKTIDVFEFVSNAFRGVLGNLFA